MIRIFAVAAILVLTMQTFAAEPAKEVKKEPAKPAEYLIGEMHVQTIPAQDFIYGSAETTFEKIGDVVNKYIPMLVDGIKEGKIIQKSCAMFVYKGIGQDMTKPFTLEVGWCVTDKAKEVGELKLRKTAEFKCATILYTGALSNIGKAYEKLMPALLAAGYQPSGESREMYLYFEDPESVNNVVQIQMGVK
jgi:effector-binding domain-containing protein